MSLFSEQGTVGSIDAGILEANRRHNEEVLERYRREQASPAGRPYALPVVTEGELINRRNRLRQVRAYTTHVFRNISAQLQEMDCAFALFDTDGCMLQLKCTDSVRTRLEEMGIRRGTLWRLEDVGINAVTVGLKEKTPLRSAGEENEAPFLRETAIYYAPLLVRNGEEEYGGIAFLVPAGKADEAYMMTVISMAVSLAIRINIAWETCDIYERDERGIVQLDINEKTGQVYINQHNRRFFDMIGAERRSRRAAYFMLLSDIIGPPPENAKFWDIVLNMQEVEDQEITFHVGGRRSSCIVTTRNNSYENLRNHSLFVTMTTRKQISKQVSDRTGNNAILSFGDIVGQSTVMKSAVRRARMLANTESNIMLLGESGVGKDVFAQAIHNQSARRNGPFVSVNCSALPRELIESELFGYDPGAFTGAKKNGNIGKFELANGGTLFLDEIGEMPLNLQATLLRAVEQKQFMRLGSTRTVHADVKIISATNVDLNQKIQEKKFRADLYYRLSTMTLHIPPLREREDDVLLLTEHFLRKYAPAGSDAGPKILTSEARDFLRSCRFDGNVRELQNLCECLAQLYNEEQVTLQMIRENINPAYFAEPAGYDTGYGQPAGVRGGFSMAGPGNGRPDPASFRRRPEDALPPEESFFLTKEEILDALERCGGNRRRAAEYLGVGRRTLYRYIDKWDIGNKFPK